MLELISPLEVIVVNTCCEPDIKLGTFSEEAPMPVKPLPSPLNFVASTYPN